MSTKFVVLSTLAVGAIYASGYAISSNTNQAMAPTAPSTNNTTASSGSAKVQSNDTSTHHRKQPSPKSTTHESSNSTASDKSSSSNSSSSETSRPSSSNSSSGGTSSSSSSASSSSSPKPASTPSKPAVNTTDKYLNGTYSGSASNQIGEVQVAVTVQSDKITNVQITGCYTHFPEGYIDPVLPNYVIAHQTTQGPVVSGATLSSEDFYGAVQQALSKAQNPNYKG